MNYSLIKQRIQDISVTLGAITTIVAGLTAIWNLYLFAQSQSNRIQNENRTNLSAYASYGQYLKTYQTDIQPAISRILQRKWNELDDEKCRTLIIEKTKSKSGIEVFGDPKYNDFRIAHNFYESLGFSLKNKTINFDIVFDLFTFPAYWDLGSKKWYLSGDAKAWLKPNFSVLRPMRECIGKNYFGEGKALKDFSDNIDQLGYNYLYNRLVHKFKNDECDLKAINSAVCNLLKNRIQDFKANKNGNEMWKRLYE
ncbi:MULTISPECIES: hypothetical protein [unclassified Microcystis]|jgi:hypothetical protein|uniref:hypothetical protein n=1 Tax=unclassified Microcystis TaxID=2643300 RepID=UPI0011907B57|nr:MULTISPECIES: hypothetical protein [unclassified Microcystis]MCA2926042.1 hypothetical protein [Microcystis sp. M020S1]MCA2936621.1 hypothetical protein [Microcystis sp. M015S1]MCA2620093.1 hypothetical protein [Microcystis sp. M099S2]MCA2649802.1 hypothetical protein [Microcystis sp. M065S2]MCA2680423.1 hypothetical protein [Microcystis sp. M043S2]